MEKSTYDSLPAKVKGFVNSLKDFNIPLEQINTNDLTSSLKPRVYVTRCYGRNKGGRSAAASTRNQMTSSHVFRLAAFYNAANPRSRGTL